MDPSGTPPGLTVGGEDPMESCDLTVAGVLIAGTGAGALWRGWKTFRSGNQYVGRWIVAGGTLFVAGCGLMIAGNRPG